MIYFIQAESGPVKIGYTGVSVTSRFQSIQTGHHEKLTLLGYIDGTRAEEAELHRMLTQTKLSGEWFAMSPELLAIMSDLQQVSEHSHPSLNFRLPQELLDSTAIYAASIERTPGWVARKALETYLNALVPPKPSRKSPRQPMPSSD